MCHANFKTIFDYDRRSLFANVKKLISCFSIYDQTQEKFCFVCKFITIKIHFFPIKLFRAIIHALLEFRNLFIVEYMYVCTHIKLLNTNKKYSLLIYKVKQHLLIFNITFEMLTLYAYKLLSTCL